MVERMCSAVNLEDILRFDAMMSKYHQNAHNKYLNSDETNDDQVFGLIFQALLLLLAHHHTLLLFIQNIVLVNNGVIYGSSVLYSLIKGFPRSST